VFVLTLRPLIGLCLVGKCEIGCTDLDGEKVIACAQAHWYMGIKLKINMASTAGNASTQTQRTRLEQARPEAFQGSWTLTSLNLEMDFLMAAARESVVESETRAHTLHALPEMKTAQAMCQRSTVARWG
jgi:hypothetical protein